MAPKSKIVDEGEVKRWISEGRTYAWMAQEYLAKYEIEIAPTTFSNFRAREGLPRRFARDDALIPWEIKKEHRFGYPLWALRAEGRMRSGLSVSKGTLDRLTSFKDKLFANGDVIHYEPDTEQGWWLVPRRPGIDLDMIREPNHVTTKRRPRD